MATTDSIEMPLICICKGPKAFINRAFPLSFSVPLKCIKIAFGNSFESNSRTGTHTSTTGESGLHIIAIGLFVPLFILIFIFNDQSSQRNKILRFPESSVWMMYIARDNWDTIATLAVYTDTRATFHLINGNRNVERFESFELQTEERRYLFFFSFPFRWSHTHFANRLPPKEHSVRYVYLKTCANESLSYHDGQMTLKIDDDAVGFVLHLARSSSSVIKLLSM